MYHGKSVALNFLLRRDETSGAAEQLRKPPSYLLDLGVHLRRSVS